MKHPKFIIEDGNLILSKCLYHKELATDKTKVTGGGWFSFNDDTFIFYGNSHDFGEASIESIKDAIAEDKVFTNKYKRHSIAKKFKFIYDTKFEIIPLN